MAGGVVDSGGESDVVDDDNEDGGDGNGEGSGAGTCVVGGLIASNEVLVRIWDAELLVGLCCEGTAMKVDIEETVMIVVD